MGSNLRRTNVDSALLQTAVNRCYAYSTERSASSRVKSVRVVVAVCVCVKMQGNSQPCKRTYLWDFTLRKKCKPIQYNWCTRFNKKRGRVLRDGSVCKARSCLAFPLWRVEFALQKESLSSRGKCKARLCLAYLMILIFGMY
jgi:hypothetical protein